MRLDVSQQMKQQMTLAPRMIQSMEILQLPLLALQERIEQEMLTNPVLEMEQPDREEDGAEVDREAADSSDNERSLSIDDDDSHRNDFERLDNITEESGDYSDYMDRSSYVRTRQGSEERDRKMEAMQNTAAPSQSLQEYLLEQWRFVDCEESLKPIGEGIINLLDESGYLTVSVDSIAKYLTAPATREQLDRALGLVRGLEPAGVGATSLGECLLIQLSQLPGDHEFEIELIRDHLKLIEKNHLPTVASKTGRSVGEVRKALETIARLDPRPGLQVGRENVHYVIPDITVSYNEDHDRYEAVLNDGSSPILNINPQYKTMLRKGTLTHEAKDYLKNNLRSAQWLIEAIEQRKATLMRVVNYVIEHQREFLDHGPIGLKPMPMVEVAEVLGVHVGTVSRAVSGKYLQTPLGIYPLRSFFSAGTETAEGESVSWDVVKMKLQEIIDNEDKSKPCSDDELAERLNELGYHVARRTVAKYRNLLNIPSARKRKQFV